MSNLLNKILGRFEALFSKPRLRIIKTLYVNFRLLPFSQAVKLPVYVYGPWKIFSLKGSIEIKGAVKRGMVRFGTTFLSPGFSRINGNLLLDGKLAVDGEFTICNGSSLNVREGTVFASGDGVVIGCGAVITCFYGISIGRGTHVPTGLYMIDTNGHHIMDMEKRTVDSIVRRIDIGEYCWIGNNVSVARGAVLPNHTIVANRSLVNRDYTKDVPEYSVIAGTPAKLIRTGFTRIYNEENEIMLRKYFEKNGHDSVYRYDGDDIKRFCYGHEN